MRAWDVNGGTLARTFEHSGRVLAWRCRPTTDRRQHGRRRSFNLGLYAREHEGGRVRDELLLHAVDQFVRLLDPGGVDDVGRHTDDDDDHRRMELRYGLGPANRRCGGTPRATTGAPPVSAAEGRRA